MDEEDGSYVGGGQLGEHADELAEGNQRSALPVSSVTAKDTGGVPTAALMRYR